MVGTMALVPQIVDAVNIPGHRRGRHRRWTRDRRVQLGTAFLGCPETAVPLLYRAQLRSATDDVTELTRAFTGLPARALRNRFVADMADAEVLGFPLQASVVAPLWQAADETARAQLTPFWAGQAAALTREAPAAEVVEKLVAEAQAALSRSR